MGTFWSYSLVTWSGGKALGLLCSHGAYNSPEPDCEWIPDCYFSVLNRRVTILVSQGSPTLPSTSSLMALIRVRGSSERAAGPGLSVGWSIPHPPAFLISVSLCLTFLPSPLPHSCAYHPYRCGYPIDTPGGVWCGGLVWDGSEGNHRPQ